MKLEQPWIGFVHVKPQVGVNPFGKGRKGAFAHVLALAADAESYQGRACAALQEAGLDVIEVSDIASVAQYREQGRIPGDIEELVESLTPESPVQFDTFDAYRENDS